MEEEGEVSLVTPVIPTFLMSRVGWSLLTFSEKSSWSTLNKIAQPLLILAALYIYPVGYKYRVWNPNAWAKGLLTPGLWTPQR